MTEPADSTEQPPINRPINQETQSTPESSEILSSPNAGDTANQPPRAPATNPTHLQLGQRSEAEWVTFIVSSLILLVLVSLVIFDWAVNQDRPPAFQIEVTQSARITDGQYYVPFAITNTGGRIARTVQVIAELHIEGEPDETGEQQIDFLSGQERKRGSFIFTHNPQSGKLVLRVASYRLP